MNKHFRKPIQILRQMPKIVFTPKNMFEKMKKRERLWVKRKTKKGNNKATESVKMKGKTFRDRD